MAFTKAISMGEMHRSKVGYDTSLRLIGKGLRLLWADILREPVPRRFRDLVGQLDSCAEKGTSSLKMEVVNELLSTAEPTARARTLLEDFRRATLRTIPH